MKTKITIQYNNCYDEKQMNVLKEDLSSIVEVDIEETEEKALELMPLFLIVIASASIFFAKGYFTKLGEKLAEDNYDFLKKKLIKTSMSPKSKRKMPSLGVKLKIDDAEVTGYVKTNREEILSDFLDKTSELYSQTLKYLKNSKMKKKIKSIVYNFDESTKNWKPSYCITTDNNVYSFEDEY